MNIMKEPIFKSLMFALLICYITLISQSLWAATEQTIQPSSHTVNQPGHSGSN